MKLKMSWNIFLSFSLIVVIQIFILWGLGLGYVKHSIQQDEEKRSETMAENVFRAFESVKSSVEQLHQVVQNSESVIPIASNYEKVNDYDILRCRRDLINYTQATTEAAAAFIYVPKKDILLSTFAPIENLEQFLVYDFQNRDQEPLRSYLMEGKEYYLRIGHDNYLNKERKELIYIAPFLRYSGTDSVPKVAVCIDFEKLAEKLLLTMPENASITLIQGDNTLHTGGFTDNNHTYSFTEKIGFDISCQVTVPGQLFQREFKATGYRLTFVLIICLAVDILLFYALSRFNTKPIRSIQEALAGKRYSAALIRSGEIEEIIGEIGKLVEKEKRLKEQTDLTKFLIKEHYIWTLLTKCEIGNTDSLERELELADITFPYCFFAVAAVNMDKQKKGGSGLILDITSYACIGYISHETEDGFAILLNFENAREEQRYLNELKGILERNGLDFNIGVGGCVEGLQDIHGSYLQSLKAMERKITGVSSSITYWEENQEKKDYILNAEDENALVYALKNGDEKNAKDILDHIIWLNLGERLSIGTMKNLFMNLMMTGWKGCCQEALQLRQTYTIDGIVSLGDSSKMQEELNTLFGEICRINIRAKHDKRNKSVLLNEVVGYLEEHYTSPSLCLTEVAEHFGIHKVYLSSMFNEKMKCSFVEFVNRKRVEQAAVYLRTGENRISDIADMVGFGSDVTFRREFKKYMGVSPKQYYDMSH